MGALQSRAPGVEVGASHPLPHVGNRPRATVAARIGCGPDAGTSGGAEPAGDSGEDGRRAALNARAAVERSLGDALARHQPQGERT